MDTVVRDAVYRFEGFIMDLARGLLLTDDGEEVELRHKSFELLRLFVENAGCLLDRDRINQVIWPDVIVNDNGITQCIRDIRRALHDDAQTIIRTVPRRGYIFTSKMAAVAGQPGRRSIADAAPLPDRPSIAVLAFTNMSGDPEQEVLLRWHRRRHHHRIVAHTLVVRDRPQFKLCLQGVRHRRETDRARARGSLRAGR